MLTHFYDNSVLSFKNIFHNPVLRIGFQASFLLGKLAKRDTISQVFLSPCLRIHDILELLGGNKER